MVSHVDGPSIEEFLEECQLSIVEKTDIPPKGSRNLPIPPKLHPRLREDLLKEFPQGLYSHQTEAINAYLESENVCLSTATASGKSLVFMSAAIDLVLKRPEAKVL